MAKRKPANARIVTLVDQRFKNDLTQKQRTIAVNYLEKAVEVNGLTDDDLSKKIAAIIEFTYEWQLDTTTSNELCTCAERLRALAKAAADQAHGNDPSAALEAGFALGVEWERFWFEAGPLAEGVRKKQGSDTGVKLAHAKRREREKARRDEVKSEAKKLLNKGQAIKRIVAKLEEDYGDRGIIDYGLSERSIYLLVLKARTELGNPN